MGFSTQHLVKEQTKMIKAILIASLATVALAEAEADPYVYSGLGGYYGGHLGYTGLGHLGYGYGLGYGHGLVYGRGLLMLSLRPRPRLILTTDTDTVLDTLDTISDTLVVSDTTARGLLMLSLRPRLMLIPTSYTVVLDTPDTMVLDTLDTLDTVDSDTTDRWILRQEVC